ncbi:MAG: hypothetical protein ACLFR6_01045 [Salinarchaeum sp.]
MSLALTADVASIALQMSESAAETLGANQAFAAAALGVGLAGLGAGIAESRIGAASVGAIAEDRDMFGTGILFTVLPETLVIFGIVIFILVFVLAPL